MVFCPECGKPVADKAKFCRNCGASQLEETPGPAPVGAPAPAVAPAPEKNLCKTCKSPLAPDEKFCGSCGARAGEASPSAAVPVPAAPAPAPVAAPAPVEVHVPHPPSNACPSCGIPYAPGTKFCGSCGAVIGQGPVAAPAPAYVAPVSPPFAPPAAAPIGVRLCTACGNPIKPGEKYCSKCLVMVKDNAPAAPVAAPAPIYVAPAAQPVTALAATPGGVRLCTACGNPIKPGEKYCSKCLVMVKDNVPVVPVASPAPAYVAPVAQPVAAPAAAPGGVRLCTACGNPIKPGEKYCSKCLVMVKDNAPAAPVAAPVPAAAPATPPAPGSYVCASCGSPLSGTEKFCGVCGGPAVAARSAAPAPAAAPAGKVCSACGAPVSDTTKFCGGCGAPVGAFFPAGTVVPSPPAGSEQVLGVIPNVKKMKMLGAAWDTYTIQVTGQRMILAQLTQEMMNVAVAEANAKAKAEGKGFFGIIGSQLSASFGFGKRYETMSPDIALAETAGNFAIDNSRITAIKISLLGTSSSNTEWEEFRLVLETMDGKFEYIIAQDDRFTTLLQTVYGDRVKLPLGLFSAGPVRIKFF
jgi:predicted amidophosphoribosyltransferase